MLALSAALLHSQEITVRRASRVAMPAPTVDGNSPGVWQDGELNVYTSTGYPTRMTGSSIFGLSLSFGPYVFPSTHYPLWIESVWRDPDGLTYAWYHHEARVCGDKLAVPSIGALVSSDNGLTFEDLGIVLASGDPVNCGAQNGFFATGNGDFSVILDRAGEYFYFLFTSYGGPLQNQGVSIASMAASDRANPAGKVWKFHDGDWDQPGVGGSVTPIFPARVAWEKSNADSFWGPAVHWNTAIEQYVMLLNHACCKTNWPQEGIYASVSGDLSDPYGWRTPAKILDSSDIGFAPGYYPQVFGVGAGETDTVAGQFPRLFVKGVSNWELSFDDTDPDAPTPPDPSHCPDGAAPSEQCGDEGGAEAGRPALRKRSDRGTFRAVPRIVK